MNEEKNITEEIPESSNPKPSAMNVNPLPKGKGEPGISPFPSPGEKQNKTEATDTSMLHPPPQTSITSQDVKKQKKSVQIIIDQSSDTEN